MASRSISGRALSQGLLDVLIRAGMITALVIVCFRVFHPFLNLMIWSLILAVTLYPLQCSLKRRMGNKEGRAATLLVLVAIVLLMLPIYLVGASMTESVQSAAATVRSGSFHVPPPADAVADWPLVGTRVYDFWQQAATDLTGLAQKLQPQLKHASLTLLGKLAGLGVGMLMFLAALILAGVFMAYGESGSRSAVQIASRIFGPGKGTQITELCTATVRAVAKGVVGIAFIQMLLIGVGFALMGVPGAGLLSIVVLLFGIMQLPATLITLPVIVFVIATQGASAVTIILAIYVFAAGLIDNVLKPLMLGRGVPVPMPVILIGALGGMVTGGIAGLFIGPVVLAVGYQLFWEWVRGQPQDVRPSDEVVPSAPEPT